MKLDVQLVALAPLAIHLGSVPAAFAGNSKHVGTQAMKHDDTKAAAVAEPGKAAQVKRTIDVTMNDTMRYEPASITGTRGETVRLPPKNGGTVKHELVRRFPCLEQRIPT